MADFSFIIPTSNADLLNSQRDIYFVKEVYDAKEISDQLRRCKQAALAGDPFYIFDHFDTYFSVIENSKNLSTIQLLRAFDLLYLTVDKLGAKLAGILNSNENIKERNSYLNLTKMTIYLLVGTVKCLDNVVCHSQTQQLKKSKKVNVDFFEGQDWEQKRFKFLIQLYDFFQLPLEKLWDPPVAEENFVNLLCDVSYRTLEIYSSKNKNVSDTVFQILGAAIKRYNHALTFPIKILQILRNSEESLIPTANGLLLLHEEFGITTVFQVLLKDIVETLSTDSGDTQIARYFSTFLTELGVIAPKLMIPHLSSVGDELLNCESHVLRNCVLQMMGDVISVELTSEDLTEEMKEIRDEFLDNLLQHIKDVSAHVRSKVLQIWNHMKEQNAVPLAYQFRVLTEAVGRLDDKTSTVRKNSVALLKSFLENNPFSAKLTLAELQKRYEEELEKLEKLKEVLVEENKKLAEIEKDWEKIIPELFPIIEDVLSKSLGELPNTQENYENMVKKVANLLVEKKYREAVVLAKQADHIAGNSEWLALKFDEQCAYYLTLLKSYIFINTGINNQINETFETQMNTVKFLNDSIEFSKIITAALPKIQEMLLSKTNSDVFEAVDFFTTGYMFGIKGTESGMRQMLHLVWSSDKEKRDVCSNAYKKVLFTTDSTGRAHAIKVVKNLCLLFEELNYGEYIAMEVLIKEWVDTNDIDLQIIQVLFERFTLKLEGTTENESRQALELLILASNAKSTIITANINVIETIGFEERGMKDPRIYVGCLSFLLNSVPTESRSKYYKRYDENHPLVQKILGCFKKLFFHPRIEDFDNVAIKTLEFLYNLGQAPDVICQKLIIDLHEKLKELQGKFEGISLNKVELPPSQTLSQLPVGQTLTQEETFTPKSKKLTIPVFLITRLIFVVGFATMKEMIFLDIDVYNNMKLRQELKEEIKNQKKKKNHVNNFKRKTINMSASESLKRLTNSAAEPQQEPNEELVGATAEDSIAELITHICEDQMLFAKNGILPKLIPIVVEICKHPGKYNDELLQQSSTLALIRFMSVSSKFCETYMPFLMNILSKTKNLKIKCNIVVGLSDLTFRFPNVLEPWTGHLYAILHETDNELRLTAAKILSHLILHEMIRVKGQIADLALCIVDEYEEIRNITKRFFKEIANKSNILYNVLPDIISKLSDVNVNVEEEKYRIIMKYILNLIHKDRQVESLVEKLCLRFSVTHEERQWRDIAYCLSLLNYTEKTIKKLTDNIQYFKDKVQVDEVYNSFKLIISNTSKLAKQELKNAVVEFESRLAECLEVREGNPEILSSSEATESRTTTTSKSKTSNRNRNKKPVGNIKTSKKIRQNMTSSESSSISEESEEEYISSSKNSNVGKRNGRLKNSQKNKHSGNKILTDSESSSELDVPQPKRGRQRK
ncbi:condensin complex subunit 1 [Condylostylus longicornis]|uniref:condensin complex subunit 1 n=1 Tax=Condylostylus longicornis TaxID=2530218 RepID=UPI00244E3AE3|nr:condensin complex subunit 1 [Condylostylus longicornis]